MKDFKKILSVFAFTTLVIIALGFLASNATAGDCDGESGAAYGLCNAYCEAMDCDGSDGGPYANDNACNRVSDNFNKITGGNLPCEAACGETAPACGGVCPGDDICVGNLLTGACECL